MCLRDRLKGVRLGYLPKRMATWAEKAFYGTCDKYLSLSLIHI